MHHAPYSLPLLHLRSSPFCSIAKAGFIACSLLKNAIESRFAMALLHYRSTHRPGKLFPSASQLASASLLTRCTRCGSAIAALNNLFLRLSCSSEVTAERAAQVMAELAEEAAQAALPAPPKPTPEPAGASDSAAQAGGGSNKKKNKKKR